LRASEIHSFMNSTNSVSSLNTSGLRNKKGKSPKASFVFADEDVSMDVNHIYQEAIYENRVPIIRRLTPLSQMRDKDLPSPRVKDLEEDYKVHNPVSKTEENIFKRSYKKLDF
jgi:hypothetical protein